MSEQPPKIDDDKKALGFLGRQEILTILIFLVLVMIPVCAVGTLIVVFSHPDLVENVDVSGSVDIGKFVDKVVESYDAFLLLLGVGMGTTGTITAVKLGKTLTQK